MRSRANALHLPHTLCSPSLAPPQYGHRPPNTHSFLFPLMYSLIFSRLYILQRPLSTSEPYPSVIHIFCPYPLFFVQSASQGSKIPAVTFLPFVQYKQKQLIHLTIVTPPPCFCQRTTYIAHYLRSTGKLPPPPLCRGISCAIKRVTRVKREELAAPSARRAAARLKTAPAPFPLFGIMATLPPVRRCPSAASRRPSRRPSGARGSSAAAHVPPSRRAPRPRMNARPSTPPPSATVSAVSLPCLLRVPVVLSAVLPALRSWLQLPCIGIHHI